MTHSDITGAPALNLSHKDLDREAVVHATDEELYARHLTAAYRLNRWYTREFDPNTNGGSHTTIAAIRLIEWFSLSTAQHIARVIEDHSIHDLGIELPNEPIPELRDTLVRASRFILDMRAAQERAERNFLPAHVPEACREELLTFARRNLTQANQPDGEPVLTFQAHNGSLMECLEREIERAKQSHSFRFKQLYSQAVTIARRWKDVQDGGLDFKALGIEKTYLKLLGMSLESSQDTALQQLAQFAALGGYDQPTYQDLREKYINVMATLQPCTVPAPTVTQRGELHLEVVSKHDPLILMAGIPTNCCFHPRGEASSSAWNALSDPNSTVWAVYQGNVLLAQAWVWQRRDHLVLDNIEAGRYGRNALIDEIYALFIGAARSVASTHGVHAVLGTGYAKIDLDLPVKSLPVPAPRGCYSDAAQVWEL